MPTPTDLSDADGRVLRHLRDGGADYPALVAANTGLHIPLVERRIATLEQRGFLEAATAERIYRITDQGERALAGDAATSVDAAGEAAADGGAPVNEE
jgi:DNA-binding IclR family transcriptional regulator